MRIHQISSANTRLYKNNTQNRQQAYQTKVPFTSALNQTAQKTIGRYLTPSAEKLYKDFFLKYHHSSLREINLHIDSLDESCRKLLFEHQHDFVVDKKTILNEALSCYHTYTNNAKVADHILEMYKSGKVHSDPNENSQIIYNLTYNSLNRLLPEDENNMVIYKFMNELINDKHISKDQAVKLINKSPDFILDQKNKTQLINSIKSNG